MGFLSRGGINVLCGTDGKTVTVLKATELDTLSQVIFFISLVIHWFFSSILLSLHVIIFFSFLFL